MERIVVHASRRQMGRKLAWCALLVMIGALLLSRDLLPWLGWTLAALGAGYGLLVLRSLGEDQERLVIDDSGIRDTAFPVGTIGWDEVQGASLQQIGHLPVIALEVPDPERVLRRLPSTRQLIARKAMEAGMPGIYISVAGTDADPAYIVEAIRQRIR
jgi:hypothetical protein